MDWITEAVMVICSVVVACALVCIAISCNDISQGSVLVLRPEGNPNT